MATAAEELVKNSCILEMHIRQPGFKKKVNSDYFLRHNGNQMEIDSQWISIAKELIPKSFLKNLEYYRSQLISNIKAMALPTNQLVLGNGQYLIPLDRVEHIREKISKFESDRSALLDKLEAEYPNIINLGRERLGKLFNEADYPAFEAIRKRYKVDYRFFSNTLPENFERLSASIRSAETARVKNLIVQETISIQTQLRQMMFEIVEDLSTKLGRDSMTGKFKSLPRHKADAIREFLHNLSGLNVMRDANLETIIKDAEKVLEGSDLVFAGKSSADLQESISEQVERIKAQATELVQEGVRKINI